MNGKVFTFYSYKGGVGRSMAMANIGALLAIWGKKTLLIDWDLEAPGLENYFKQGNETRLTELNQKEGLIDLLLKRKNNTSFSPDEIKWNDFISTLSIRNTANSDKPVTVDILTTGRKDDTYIKRVREMDYGSFYDDHQGGAFLEEIREYWTGRYDFVLIDSRTGLTDSSGVCSIQMPDVLVMLFTATDLGFKGTLEIAQRAIKAQKTIIYDRYTLKVLPIPTRFDSTEFKLQQDWLSKFVLGLKPIYSTWVPDYPQDDKINIDHRKILDLTKLPYIPYFSYGESLPVIEQGTDDPQGLGYAFETLAAILSHNLEGAKLLVENRSEYVRRAIKGISPDHREEEINVAVPVIARTVNSKYMILGLGFIGVVVLLLFIFGRNRGSETLQADSIQVDSLIRKIDIVTLQSFFASIDTNNIHDILELNKQVYASGLNKDTTETIYQIKKTIFKSVQDELEFTLPLIYQEFKSYKTTNTKDLTSNKDVYDVPASPIEKYFSDTILQFGPFTRISNEYLRIKLESARLEGFLNKIAKDSITLIDIDSAGFVVKYTEEGNYYFKDTSYVSDTKNYSIPVTVSLNQELKIYKVEYRIPVPQITKDLSGTGSIRTRKPVVTMPQKAIEKSTRTRIDLFTTGIKSSRQLLQLDAIYEELTRNKAYLTRKSGWKDSKEINLSGANEIRCNKSDLSRAQALQKLLLDQLNISFSIRTGDYTPNYLSIYLAGGDNKIIKKR